MSTGSDFWGGDGGVKEERPGGVRETGYRKSLWAAVTIPCLFLTIFPPLPPFPSWGCRRASRVPGHRESRRQVCAHMSPDGGGHLYLEDLLTFSILLSISKPH